MGLRERKRQRMRAAVVKTAYRLFTEHGYDDTTVEMIADAADVSPRTFYRYFETKDGVLAEGGYEVVDRTVERVGDDPGLGRLVAAMADVYDELLEEDDFEQQVRLLRENPRLADAAPAWRQRWSAYLADQLAAASGAPEPSREHRFDSTAAVHIVGAAVEEWLYSAREASVAEIVGEVLDHLRASLALDEGTSSTAR